MVFFRQALHVQMTNPTLCESILFCIDCVSSSILLISSSCSMVRDVWEYSDLSIRTAPNQVWHLPRHLSGTGNNSSYTTVGVAF
jgi:hypothetical protein